VGRIPTALTLLLYFSSGAGVAQQLYEAGRDSQAKQGADAAAKLATGDLWDKLVRNLVALSREDIQTYLLDQQVRMRATIDTMVTWGQVDDAVKTVGQTLGAEDAVPPDELAKQRSRLTRQKTDLDSQIKKTGDALAQLRKDQTTVPESLRPVFDNLGDIVTAVQKLKDVAGTGQAAIVANRINDAVVCLAQIQSVYTAADRGLKSVRDLRAQLGGLDLEVARTILLRLQADEEHLKNQAAIIARRSQEEADLLRILRDYQVRYSRLNPKATDEVPDTLLRAASSGDPEQRRAAVFDQAGCSTRRQRWYPTERPPRRWLRCGSRRKRSAIPSVRARPRHAPTNRSSPEDCAGSPCSMQAG